MTGGGSGIGRAIAIELGRTGFDVSIQVNKSVDAGRPLSKNWRPWAERDCSRLPISQTRLLRADRSLHSGKLGHLDAIVLNAAISSATSIFDLDDAELDAVIDTNLKAPIIVASEFMRSRRASGNGGAIVIIGSAAGQTGGALVDALRRFQGWQHALVKSLANAGAPFGIRVNGVAPGFVDTAD